MRVRVELFAPLREIVGIHTEWKEIAAGTTVEQLWRAYTDAYPRLARVRVVYAVNQKRVTSDYVLQDGDYVSFVSPIGGGS